MPSHKINFPMHGGHRIMHLSQKENNSGFSAFKITGKRGFSFFQQGISMIFIFIFIIIFFKLINPRVDLLLLHLTAEDLSLDL